MSRTEGVSDRGTNQLAARPAKCNCIGEVGQLACKLLQDLGIRRHEQSVPKKHARSGSTASDQAYISLRERRSRRLGSSIGASEAKSGAG
jgi:hypothetical protein